MAAAPHLYVTRETVSAEPLARRLHERQRLVALAHPFPPRVALVPWEELPAQNRRLMVAVVADLVNREILAPDCVVPAPPCPPERAA
jgi:hypothetical protein